MLRNNSTRKEGKLVRALNNSTGQLGSLFASSVGEGPGGFRGWGRRAMGTGEALRPEPGRG